ncbi:MAG TPA: PorV/PorQ family protein [bacterium]|nr:PorV/PorQ family protein [bacterium]HQI49201.1 PorV/PorQ family protein [bacterium]HQJ64294.1 PorV/PorQ family protein [bacterium]
MKAVFNKTVLVTLAILVVLAAQAFAGASNRAGTNAASELLIPVGARYIGMGGATAASVQGIDAIYWNPAGLDRASYRATAQFSQMSYLAGIDVTYAAVAAKFGGLGSIGLSFKTLAMGDIAITTEDAPDGTGALFSPQFLNLGLTYSRALTDRVSVGASAKLISETIDRVGASGLAFDIGVQYQNLGDINGLGIGVTLRNLGPGMTYDGNGLLLKANPLDVQRSTSFYKVVAGKDELPSTLDLGLSYKINIAEKNSLSLHTTIVNNNYDDDYANLGAEYSFEDMIFLRGGYGLPLAGDKDATGAQNHIYGFTAGGGFQKDFGGLTVMFDYAYRAVEYFDGNNVFTLSLGF